MWIIFWVMAGMVFIYCGIRLTEVIMLKVEEAERLAEMTHRVTKDDVPGA